MTSHSGMVWEMTRERQTYDVIDGASPIFVKKTRVIRNEILELEILKILRLLLRKLRVLFNLNFIEPD